MYKSFTALCLFLLFYTCHAHAQRKYREHVQEVILAEVSFAKMAADVNIKNAFLHYLDSNGLVFRSGHPVNGIAVYNEVPATAKDLLAWHPVVAHASASGELGFTSGPYAYHTERNKDAVARGYYFTVWKKNGSGEYKVLLDGGVSGTPGDMWEPTSLNELRNFSSRKPGRDTLGLVKAEEQFARTTIQEVGEAYQRFLSDSSWLLRTGQQAGRNKASSLALLQGVESYRFTLLGQGMAKSNDLGYTYGLAEAFIQKEREKRTGFFIRVWQHAGTEWKIIADVLSLQ